jgi:hypothetical protein
MLWAGLCCLLIIGSAILESLALGADFALSEVRCPRLILFGYNIVYTFDPRSNPKRVPTLLTWFALTAGFAMHGSWFGTGLVLITWFIAAVRYHLVRDKLQNYLQRVAEYENRLMGRAQLINP